jgi:hypothetical protein
VAGAGDFAPTDQAVAVRDQLVAAIDEQLQRLDDLLGAKLTSFNDLVRGKAIPAVWLDAEE